MQRSFSRDQTGAHFEKKVTVYPSLKCQSSHLLMVKLRGSFTSPVWGSVCYEILQNSLLEATISGDIWQAKGEYRH